jgi:hypothetical protein
VQVACHRSRAQLQHSTTELDLLCSKRVRFRNRVFIREQCKFLSVHSVISLGNYGEGGRKVRWVG